MDKVVKDVLRIFIYDIIKMVILFCMATLYIYFVSPALYEDFKYLIIYFTSVLYHDELFRLICAIIIANIVIVSPLAYYTISYILKNKDKNDEKRTSSTK
jgi:hypothetical protein